MTRAGHDALVFDFDGVILESVDIKTTAFTSLYAEHGPDIVERVRAWHLAHGGISRFEKIRHFETLLPNRPPLSAERERELAARFAELVVEAVIAAPMVAGVAKVLDRYRGRVPMFVFSGTPQDELERIIGARRLGDHFVSVHGSPTAKDSHLATLIARYRWAPGRVLVIGDAMTDYQAAVANNTRFLGRVAPGSDNPFPPDVPVVADFSVLDDGNLDAFLSR